MKAPVVCLFFILCSVYICFSNNEFNPYHILNVAKTAKLAEIRKSYKKLVRKWHPDKNKAPDAQDKFIKVQQAYEILSNDEKRNQYDNQGFSSSNNRQWNNQPRNFRYSDFFSNDFYDFGFDDTTSSRSVSNHQFFQKVVPNSHHTPQILYVYSTFCARCIAILKTSWERAAKDLEKLGISVGTVDTTFSSRISSFLRVYSLPTIVMVFEEEYSYYQGMISYENIKNFITSQLPQHLVQTVTSSSIDSFLSGLTYDDKPRSLLFSKQLQPTLLYVLMSIKHKKYIKFGFVSLSDSNSKAIAKKYGVRGFGPTLLIFKEDLQNPAVSLQSSDMPRGAVNDILTTHRYMIVPRLTSQEVFDDVCPPPSGQSFHVSLCAIYVTNDKKSNYEETLNNLRQLVEDSLQNDEQLSDWLKFVFVIDHKQQGFVKSLRDKEEAPVKPELLLLWRRSEHSGRVSTFSSDFLASDVSQEYGFQKFLAACLQSSHQRQFERNVRFLPLNDELAPFLVTRLAIEGWKKAVALVSYYRNISEQEMMLVLITLVVIGLSLLSAYNNLFSNQKKETPRSATPPPNRYEDESDIEVDVAFSDDEDDEYGFKKSSNISIEALKPTTYDDLILHRKRGHLTIVLLLARSDHIVDDFTKIAMVYERDQRLSFCYLQAKSYMSWYVELRKSSSAQPTRILDQSSASGLSSLHSNNSDTHTTHTTAAELTSDGAHGTVLACNGSKHWYCIFVPRIGRGRAEQSVAGAATTSAIDDVLGDGDGPNCFKPPPLDDDDDELPSSHSQIPASGNLLSGCDYYTSLAHWMDRVCEGQLPRLYLRQWPGLYMRPADLSDDE